LTLYYIGGLLFFFPLNQFHTTACGDLYGFQGGGIPVTVLFSIYLFSIFEVSYQLPPPGSYSKDIKYDSWINKEGRSPTVAAKLRPTCD
jgi:hypothetical protein